VTYLPGRDPDTARFASTNSTLGPKRQTETAASQQ
jgi:hypothetical protein